MSFGVTDIIGVLEKGRQMADIYIAILINSCRQHFAAVLFVKSGKVRAAAEEGHSKGGLRDNHSLYSFLNFRC